MIQNSLVYLDVLQAIREDAKRIGNDIPQFCDAVRFSPHSYNAISTIILETIYDCIEEIASLESGISYFYNLGIILYKEILIIACGHYYREYERHYQFVDTRLDDGNFLEKKSAFPHSRLQAYSNKIHNIFAKLWIKPLKNDVSKVAWAGSTTISWDDLASELAKRQIRFAPIKTDGCFNIPASDKQIQALTRWAARLHIKMATTLAVPLQKLQPLDNEIFRSLLQQIYSIPAVCEAVDLLVTGTLGKLTTRLAALQVQLQGGLVMTLEHGSYYNTHDEPWWSLYESNVLDIRLGYGQIDKQRALGTIPRGKNLAGRDIQYFGRSDDTVLSLYGGGTIGSAEILTGKTAVYIAAAGGGWMEHRYGPYRDIHPATYLAWQEKLLHWLEQQTGEAPMARLHPKRNTTRYDIVDYTILDGDLRTALNIADFFVIDYPSTTLAYLAAMDKPILFFDIGLRRLFPVALDILRERCYYAAVDILYPEAGFKAMAADFSRQCQHSFSPLFSLIEDRTKGEMDSIAEIIADIAQQGLNK